MPVAAEAQRGPGYATMLESVLANPDFVERIRNGAELNAPDFTTLFGGGAKGYIDYPALA